MNPAAHGQLPAHISRGTSSNPSPKHVQAPADREGIRKTVLISFVSTENAGRSPRNSVRSWVVMATGGNRLELGRVLAFPGWSRLAWMLAGTGMCARGCPEDMAQAPAGCWIGAREGQSSPGWEREAGPHTALGTPCPPALPAGRQVAGLPAEYARCYPNCKRVFSSRTFPTGTATCPPQTGLSSFPFPA